VEGPWPWRVRSASLWGSGAEPQRGPAAEPLVKRSGGEAPLKLKLSEDRTSKGTDKLVVWLSRMSFGVISCLVHHRRQLHNRRCMWQKVGGVEPSSLTEVYAYAWCIGSVFILPSVCLSHPEAPGASICLPVPPQHAACTQTDSTGCRQSLVICLQTNNVNNILPISNFTDYITLPHNMEIMSWP